ncbi:hypothetical protein Tco_1038302 [Tanacetum coccineum]
MPQRLTKSFIYSRSLGLAACASLERASTKCASCEVNLEQIPAFDFFLASLETISAIEVLWEWRGIANMDFIKLGGSSRVLSDFCREVWEQKKTGCWLVLVLAGKLGKGFIQVGL